MLKKWYILTAAVILTLLSLVIGFTSLIWNYQSQSYSRLQELNAITLAAKEVTRWSTEIQNTEGQSGLQQFAFEIKLAIDRFQSVPEVFTEESLLDRIVLGHEYYLESIEELRLQFGALHRTALNLQAAKTNLDVHFFADSLHAQSKHGLGNEATDLVDVQHVIVEKMHKTVMGAAWLIVPIIALIMWGIWKWMITPIFARMKENWKALKASEEAAQLTAEVAIETNRAKTEFISEMSHELRTPLNAVIGLSAQLRDANKPIEHKTNELNDIVKNAQYLSVMIDGIIDYTVQPAAKRPSAEVLMGNLRAAQEKIADQPKVQDKPLGAGISILAADDNRLNRVVLEKLVQGLGGTLDIVNDGDEAVKAWQQKPYDLLLFDIAMPNMTGDQALEVIRAQEDHQSNQQPMAIAITANTLDHQVDGYFKAGFNDCIAKPVTRQKLIKSINHVLAGRVVQ